MSPGYRVLTSDGASLSGETMDLASLQAGAGRRVCAFLI